MCIRLPVDDTGLAPDDDLPLVALVDALVEALMKVEPQERWEPVQRWRQAEPGDAEACVGPASIWDVALLAGRTESQGDLFGELLPAEEAPVAPPHHRTVDKVRRMKGKTVVAGLAYPSGRWTDERAAREATRRAKQIVPRPTAAVSAWKVRKV